MMKAHEIQFVMTPGGACESLPVEVYDKYFQCNNSTEHFLARTAKAICARCPVQELCLENAVNSSPVMRGGQFVRNGVVGGMSVNEIHRIQVWEAYDKGLRKEPPKKLKRVARYKSATPPRPPGYRPEPKVTVADLSYEERVYLIFREVKEGKYKTLNDAVRDIAALHEADRLRQQGELGRPWNSILNFDQRRLMQRPGLTSPKRTKLTF